MNNEIKQEWIAALRSGEYKQAKHVLNGDGGMCCLGVLCDLYMKKTEKVEWGFREVVQKDPLPLQKYKTVGVFGGEDSVPPAEVTAWAELPKDNPDTGVNMGHHKAFAEEGWMGFSLAELNDGGLTFNQIADVIQFAL